MGLILYRKQIWLFEKAWTCKSLQFIPTSKGLGIDVCMFIIKPKWQNGGFLTLMLIQGIFLDRMMQLDLDRWSESVRFEEICWELILWLDTFVLDYGNILSYGILDSEWQKSA